MEFSVLIRPALAAIKGFITLIRRPLAERKALKAPEQENHSIYSIMEKTLVHLGVDPSTLMPGKERWILLLERRIVIAEPFTLPYVNAWLNLADVQEHLKHLAACKLTHDIPLHDSELVLIKSYMDTTGETETRARDIILQAVTTIVTGTLSGLKDPELGTLLKIHSHALHERINQLSEQLFPEEKFTLPSQCLTNARWLTETLSSKPRAKTRLGQALCPGDSGPILQRATLQKQFCETLSALPDGGIIVVTGAEGNGKSWLVTQSWLSLTLKPLTAFIRAEDIEEPFNNIEAIVIRALCRSCQTDTAVHTKFWQEQFRLWVDLAERPVSGMIVILDGINQRPTIRWAQFIDQLSEFLQVLGGKLIVTSRQHYFTQSVETRLVSLYKKCFIPEWSTEERDQILALRNIKIIGRELSEKVAISLCNPRMLGIALELFNAEQLHDLKELSVSLMLFEHIKTSHRDSYELSAELFSKRLRKYGQDVLDRFGKDNEDIDVFNADLDSVFDGGLHAVIDGRFFVSLPEDSTRYRINPEGLSLALGLAILDIVNKAERNHKDLDEAIASVVEPVMALDKTSDTLFAALTVACLDSRHPERSGVAILVGFAGLQNPDSQLASAFVALARRRPQIFLKTCEHLALHNKNLLQHYWIEDALIQSARHPNSSEMVRNVAAQWLGWVPSSFPQSSIRSTQADVDMAAEIEELRKKQDVKISQFSPREKKLFATLVFKDSDSFSGLHLLAFKLLAGKALMPCIDDLIKWSFSYSLIQNYGAPWREFRDLIAFNAFDWQDVRLQLQDHWELSIRDGASNTGKWAAINLLMATGHSDDAKKAEALAHQLRDNSLERKGWHINESWCKADPCDPTNTESDNVNGTADKHTQLDVSKLYNSDFTGYEESFFSGAATSLARYRPQVAVGNYRRLAEDVLQRSGMPLRQGIFSLLPHRALITPDIARELAKRVTSTADTNQAAWQSLGEESNLLKQFQLLLSFHQLNSQEQLSTLKELHYGNKLLITLVENIKPLDWEDLEKHLLPALSHNSKELYTLLLFHPNTRPLPLWLMNALPQILDNSSCDVKHQILRMLIKFNEPEALSHVEDILTFTERRSLGHLEEWYVSALIFQAIVKKVIRWEEGLSSLKYTHLAQLSGIYGGKISDYTAEYFDSFLNRVLQKNLDISTLQITLTLESTDDRAYNLPHLSEVKDPERESGKDVEDFFKSQSIENFKEHQQLLQERYKAVKEILSELNLSELTNHFYSDDFSALVIAKPDRALAWAGSLLNDKNIDSLHLVRHIGLVLAQVLSDIHPALSVQLFERFDTVIPFTNVVYTAANIDLSAVAVWSAFDSQEIKTLRWHRLFRAKNNDMLAHEVWAALFCRQDDVLKKFIQDSCKSSWPVCQARGIMVAGYLSQNDISESVLKTNSYSGLLQKTVESAYDSYQRHLWTLHWFGLMQTASSAQEFWCAYMTFIQVVDERFLVLKRDKDSGSNIYMQYWPCVEAQLSSRFQKLRRKRAEHLFGGKEPWPGFLEI